MIIIILIYNIATLIEINTKLKQDYLEDSLHEGLRMKLMKRLIYYPIVLIICVIPAALNRIITLSADNNLNMYLISAVFQCLLGFGNCIVYGFTDNLKRKIRRRFNKLLEHNHTTDSSAL